MNQRAVASALGRLITDAAFRARVSVKPAEMFGPWPAVRRSHRGASTALMTYAATGADYVNAGASTAFGVLDYSSTAGADGRLGEQ